MGIERRDALTKVHAVETDGLTWLAVHGVLCLGLRHPSYDGPSRALVLNFVREVGDALVTWGVFTRAELTAAQRVERQESPHGDAGPTLVDRRLAHGAGFALSRPTTGLCGNRHPSGWSCGLPAFHAGNCANVPPVRRSS